MAEILRPLILMWMMFIIFLGRKNPSVTAINTATSAISAAPAFLPAADPPLDSPSAAAALSPDITPLFPTTGGPAFSPADSSILPTIPSSLSPPNPDAIKGGGAAPGPFSPLSSSLPASSAVRFAPVSTIHLLGSAVHLLLLPGLVAWCLSFFIAMRFCL